MLTELLSIYDNHNSHLNNKAMYYKTLKTSETGKKIAEVLAKAMACEAEARKIVEVIGADQWRGAKGAIAGGISALIFSKGSNIPDYLREVAHKEYFPRRNVGQGRALGNAIKGLPLVAPWELNECVGYKPKWQFSHIGIVWEALEENFLFHVSEKAAGDYLPPADCEEILTSEFLRLQGK